MRTTVTGRGNVIPGRLHAFVLLIGASIPGSSSIMRNGAESKVTLITQSTEFRRYPRPSKAIGRNGTKNSAILGNSCRNEIANPVSADRLNVKLINSGSLLAALLTLPASDAAPPSLKRQ